MSEQNRRIYDWSADNYKECEVVETNGNLSLVRFENGEEDWVSNQEVENY